MRDVQKIIICKTPATVKTYPQEYDKSSKQKHLRAHSRRNKTTFRLYLNPNGRIRNTLGK